MNRDIIRSMLVAVIIILAMISDAYARLGQPQFNLQKARGFKFEKQISHKSCDLEHSLTKKFKGYVYSVTFMGSLYVPLKKYVRGGSSNTPDTIGFKKDKDVYHKHISIDESLVFKSPVKREDANKYVKQLMPVSGAIRDAHDRSVYRQFGKVIRVELVEDENGLIKHIRVFYDKKSIMKKLGVSSK